MASQVQQNQLSVSPINYRTNYNDRQIVQQQQFKPIPIDENRGKSKFETRSEQQYLSMLNLFDKLTLDDCLQQIYDNLEDYHPNKLIQETINLQKAAEINECNEFSNDCQWFKNEIEKYQPLDGYEGKHSTLSSFIQFLDRAKQLKTDISQLTGKYPEDKVLKELQQKCKQFSNTYNRGDISNLSPIGSRVKQQRYEHYNQDQGGSYVWYAPKEIDNVPQQLEIEQRVVEQAKCCGLF